MQSPTQKITTPKSAIEVEIKDWITGGEAEEIEKELYKKIEMKPDMIRKTATMNNFDATIIADQIHKEIEKFVVSVGGKTENVLQSLLELPEDDVNFVKDEIASRRSKKKIVTDGQLPQ